MWASLFQTVLCLCICGWAQLLMLVAGYNYLCLLPVTMTYACGRLQLFMPVAGYNYLYLWQAITIIGVTNIRLMHNFTKRATVILHQRKIHADFVNAAGGHVKWLPPGAIFPQKCGCWHFENAVGRENPAKPRPLDSISGLHRPRSRMTVSARLFLCLHKWMRK